MLSYGQGVGERLFLEGGAPVPAQNSRSRAGVETWERLSLEDPESKAREPSEGWRLALGGLLTEKKLKMFFDRKNLGFRFTKITFLPR